jgi:formate hydrogenlyase subunit 3/multisubunit Na+/H+ antiporter MnhD subunit
MHKRALQILFTFILVTLTAWNVWTSTQQPVWEWGGLTTPPDNLWTIATLLDAYYGFITFFVWVCWKESRTWPRTAWFLAIMLLGNVAMSVYVLRQLARLAPGDGMDRLLAGRNP